MPGNEAEAADLLDAYLARAGGTSAVSASAADDVPRDAAAPSTVPRTVAPTPDAR